MSKKRIPKYYEELTAQLDGLNSAVISLTAAVNQQNKDQAQQRMRLDEISERLEQLTVVRQDVEDTSDEPPVLVDTPKRHPYLNVETMGWLVDEYRPALRNFFDALRPGSRQRLANELRELHRRWSNERSIVAVIIPRHEWPSEQYELVRSIGDEDAFDDADGITVARIIRTYFTNMCVVYDQATEYFLLYRRPNQHEG